MTRNLLLFLALLPQYLFAQQVPQTAPLFFEKVYLHTDRDAYLAGDTLWFSAYLVDPVEGKLRSLSRNLYVELIAADAKIAASALVRLDGGIGQGNIDLSDELHSGNYRLRAYTNWMRNYGDNFFFEKKISVGSSPGHAAGASPNAVTAAFPHAAAGSSAADPRKPPVLSFYPEGGSMVEGLASKVGVKARSALGKGIGVSGILVSSQNDTVARFRTDSLGFGSLALLPVHGLSYRAVIEGWENAPALVLAPALPGGPVLAIRQTDSLVRAVITVGGDSTRRSAYTLLVRHSGKVVFSQQFTVSVQASLSIPAKMLPPGVSAVSLYEGDNRKPSCERLVYVHQAGQGINVSLDQSVYPPGEKITLAIGAEPGTQLSLAAVDAEAVPEQVGDIVSYLQLESELRGRIEQPARYFDTTNVNRFQQMELLLLTQGWRDFLWRSLADTTIRISYLPEDGITIGGRVKMEYGKALPGMSVSLYATAAKGVKLFSATADSAGRFYFPGLEYYGSQPIKLSAVNEKGVNRGTFYLDTLIRPTALKFPPTGAQQQADSLGQERVSQALNQRKALAPQVKKAIALKEVKLSTSRKVEVWDGVFSSFGPDQVFNIGPADKEYKTLEWYLLQHAKGAQKILAGDTTGIVFSGSDTLLYGGTRENPRYRLKTKLLPPLIYVNGRQLIAIDNDVAEVYRNNYYSMPIDRFKQIVLKKVVGTLPYAPTDASRLLVDRFLLYLTLTEEASWGDNPGVMNTNYPGYERAKRFYEPLNGEESINAGYRATLFWKPDLVTDATGKTAVSFFAGAAKGGIRIVLQGITPYGKPVAATTVCTVK